jgi:hypothetical protein
MRFAEERMGDPAIQEKKIGDFAKRSMRNEIAELNEDTIRSLCPFPISYDVNQTQGLNFSEYTYTELLSGFWVATQSLEINCRLLLEASKYSEIDPKLAPEKIVADKYVLSEDIEKYKHVKKICFLPGHNMLDVASVEIISRLIHDNDDIMLKPHPITNSESLNIFGSRFGWNKVIPKDISGNALLKNCDVVYTTTASEMAISGTLLGKQVVNISNFSNEGSGAYHPISRILFEAHKHGVAQAQDALLRIFSCPWSGVVTAGSENVSDRIAQYYKKSLEYRDFYKPLASPRGNNPNKKA